MRKRIVILAAFVFIFSLTNIFASASYSLSVIPGGKGFGNDTPAGSGRHWNTTQTNVIKVTNLNDSGSGSLRDALENRNSPKVIIFEVSGNISLKSPIKIGGYLGVDAETRGSYITIAGQTAPSPGITIRDYGIKIERNCHDILIQHIRIRPGDTSIHAGVAKESISDPIKLDDHYSATKPWTTPYNIVIDHCSISWGGDMNVQSGADNFTFTYNISSEALNHPLHPKGPHSKGFLAKDDSGGVSGSRDVFIAYNIFAHNVDRNPRVAGGNVVIANNIIYDVKFGPWIDDATSNNGPVVVSIAGNYIKETATNKMAMYICGGENSSTRIYIAKNNYYSGAVQTDPWNSEDTTSFEQRRRYTLPNTDVPIANRSISPPIWPEGYTVLSAASARILVLENSGARPADRDSVDTRIINQVKNESKSKGAIIEDQNDVGGWPNLAKNHRTLTIPANPNQVQSSGYTKLEEWLHGYLKDVEGEGEPSPPSPPENVRIL